MLFTSVTGVTVFFTSVILLFTNKHRNLQVYNCNLQMYNCNLQVYNCNLHENTQDTSSINCSGLSFEKLKLPQQPKSRLYSNE